MTFLCNLLLPHIAFYWCVVFISLYACLVPVWLLLPSCSFLVCHNLLLTARLFKLCDFCCLNEALWREATPVAAPVAGQQAWASENICCVDALLEPSEQMKRGVFSFGAGIRALNFVFNPTREQCFDPANKADSLVRSQQTLRCQLPTGCFSFTWLLCRESFWWKLAVGASLGRDSRSATCLVDFSSLFAVCRPASRTSCPTDATWWIVLKLCVFNVCSVKCEVNWAYCPQTSFL